MGSVTAHAHVAVPSNDNSHINQTVGKARSVFDSDSMNTDTMDHRTSTETLATIAANRTQRSSIRGVVGRESQLNKDMNPPPIEESLEARLERLGRQRPDVFPNIWAEVGFVFSISMSQVLSVSTAYSNLIYGS
jgi:hypothetical protein